MQKNVLFSCFLKSFYFIFFIHLKFHLWITRHFIPFFICAYIIHTHTLAIKWNAFCRTCIVSIENMGDQLDAWIGVVRHIQEEFRHDVWEIEESFTKSTNLVKRHIEAEIIYLRNLHICLFNRPFNLLHISPIAIITLGSWAIQLRI